MMAAESRNFLKLADVLSKSTNGRVTIQVLGGPEVVPGFDQGQAVRRGVVDIAYLPATFYEGMAPAAKFVLLSSRTPSKEEYTNGIVEELRKIHESAGLYFLGRADVRTDLQFIVGLKNPITAPSQLKGLKIGVGGVWYEDVSPKYGTTMVLIPLPEAYTSLERGVVNGFAVPYNTFVSLGLHEPLKNFIDYPIYRDNKVMLINPAKWNSIPQDLRQTMEKAYLDYFPTMETDYRVINEQGKETIAKAGGKFITFSEEDARWFVDTSFTAMWDEFKAKFPNESAKFLPLMGAPAK